MLRRLLLGLSEGLVIGLALGVACARGLGFAAPGGIVLGLLAALTGFAMGLVAGRPVWAHNAKIEALLKAGAGALAGFGLSFALRRWLTVEVDLSAFSLGAGPAGQLASLALPAVATALGLFFELDDDGERNSGEPRGKRGQKQRLETGTVADASLDDTEELADTVDRKLEKR